MQYTRLTKLTAALALAGISASAVAITSGPQIPRSATLETTQTDAQNRALYIVRLGQPSVATHLRAEASAAAQNAAPASASLANGASTRSAISSSAAIPGSAKLNIKSPQAVSYANQLSAQQDSVLSAASATLQRPLNAEHHYRYALNGFAIRLTAQEAQAMRQAPGVVDVIASRNSELKTNVSMALIGAPTVWNDPAPVGNRGEGAVIGMLDTGLNFSSPAFSGFESPQYFPWYPLGGPSYQFTNPLGAGNYFGWCNPGYYPGDATGHDPCNDKVIGSWDFVNAVATADTSAVHDNPGSNDQDGHGSHTSSTSAGNNRGAIYQGGAYILSGVAPHANIVISQVCYDFNKPDGSIGSTCPNTGSINAVEEAIQDGIVDVLSYSIGPSGGDSSSPWDDPGQVAFLSAVDAGIFVSTAAGNDGPGASTLSNQAPWNATVAATTTGRQSFSKQLVVSGPGAPPANASKLFTAYAGGAPFTSAFPSSTSVSVSAGYGPTNDGCSPFAAGTFAHAIAVIQRGSCAFVVKQQNAADAGALAVIIANNRAGAIGGIVTVVGLPIPVFTMSQADGNALAAFSTSNGNTTTASLGTTGVAVPGIADQVASFSSRGPTSQVNVLKPDIGAPGVDILASFSGDYTAVGEDSGTSMATPHIAGAAALVHVAHPGWSPPEIKSALMLTAKNAGLQTQAANGSVSPSTPTDVGSGRVQVDQAVHAGLVMNELGVNFAAANPAAGGDPRTLNLASLYDENCVGHCNFTRSFRGTATKATQWTVAVGTDAGVTATVTPSTFTALPGVNKAVKFSIDTSGVTTPGWFYGEVTLTPSDSSPVLHLPLAVNVAAQQIEVDSTPITANVAVGGTATGTLTISNVGGVPLNWEIQNSGSAEVEPVAQVGNNNNGYSSDKFLGDSSDIYNADDVSLYGTHSLEYLVVEGFTQPAIQQIATADTVTFKIYSDANGVPAGNPDAGSAGEIYSCTRSTHASDPTNAGLATGGRYDTVQLDVGTAAANGCPAAPALAGKYWVVAYPTFAGNSTGTIWYRQQSVNGSGSTPVSISPSNGDTAWAAILKGGAPLNGLAMDLYTSASCGASWLSVAPSTGTVNGQDSGTTTVTFNATGLAVGKYNANVCVNSDDQNNPSLVAPVVLTVH